MIIFSPRFLLVCALTFSAAFAHAATDSFITRTLVGEDTTAPTIPANFTASPISPSQINLAWDASWDDFGVSGYQVFRDGTQIATSTSLAYSDVGLTASTTYSYYVTAFDIFNNLSASSTEAATTTYPLPPPPPVATSTGIQYGSVTRLPELVSLEIIPSQYGATIKYETRGNVRSIVRWGKTVSYEAGSSAERSFTVFHETTLTELKPGALYRLRIEGENHLGRTGVFTETSFMTLPADDTVPPGNVMDLRAIRRGDDVVLTWVNPLDIDFDRVRVLRSSQFYPNDTADGWVVYEGEGDTAEDRSVLTPTSTLYYTVFTYDEEGNISSGAVVKVSTLPEPPPQSDNDLQLSFTDLEFYQEDTLLRSEGTTLIMNGGQYLTIALPYERVPEHLKAILVTLTPADDPDTVLRFLLRVNKEKTAYTARIAPFGVSGVFSLQVSVFDLETSQIGYSEGTLRSLINIYDEESGTGIPGVFNVLMSFSRTTYLIFFILLLTMLAILSRRLLRAEW